MAAAANARQIREDLRMLFRNRGRLSLALATLAALALALPAGAQTRGGSATIGVEQDIAGFDPLIVGVYDTGQEATAVLLFETLIRLDDNGKPAPGLAQSRSEEHTSELQSQFHLVCRLLLEKKKKKK